MFPFAPSTNFLALGNYPSMGALIAGWLGYEVFAAGTPTRDPGRAPYWTGVYLDAGGAGRIVSHAAPVYVGDRFMGVVGTDILLAYLEDLLSSVDWQVGRVLLVNDVGQVLASSRTDGVDTKPDTVADALPETLATMPLAELLAGPSGFRSVAGSVILAERLADAPFSLLVAIPEWDLTWAILPRFKPYALILAGLMLALLAAHFLLQRRFVRPALLLVRHIQDESEGLPSGGARGSSNMAALVRFGEPRVRGQPRLPGTAHGQRGPTQSSSREHPGRPRHLRCGGSAGIR